MNNGAHVKSLRDKWELAAASATQRVAEVRYYNLRALVRYHGNTNLAGKLGLSPQNVSQVAGDKPTRQLTTDRARDWERLLQLPAGWFDTRQTHAGGIQLQIEDPPARLRATPQDLRAQQPDQADRRLSLEIQAAVVVFAAHQQRGLSIPAAKLGDILALVIADACVHEGALRETYVNDLLNLAAS